MTNFAVVTESTADIPPELAAERQIFTTPMHIYWEGEDLRDGIDITPQAFYERLVQAPTHPTTSQPTLPEFVALFRKAINQTGANAVIALTMSSKLSGTYNAAVQAAQMVDFPVFPVDTRTGSLAHGLTALAIADARDRGIAIQDAVELAKKLAAQTKMVFALDTLEYLYRSGRVSKLQNILGNALQIKPILHVTDGTITMLEMVRSRRRQMRRLFSLFDELVDADKPLRVGVLHGNAMEDMQTLLNNIKERWMPKQLVTNMVCPPVGVHTGPGSLGFAILQDEES